MEAVFVHHGDDDLQHGWTGLQEDEGAALSDSTRRIPMSTWGSEAMVFQNVA